MKGDNNENSFKNLLSVTQGLLRELEKYAPEHKKKVVQFIFEQLSLLLLHKNNNRYSSDLLVLSSLLFSISPHCYKFLRNSAYVTLPHPSTLKRLFSEYNVDPKVEQIPENFLNYAKEKIRFLEENDKYVTLIVDKIHIKPFLDVKGGNIIGIAYNCEKAANSACVFMLQSIRSSYKDVISILYKRLLQCGLRARTPLYRIPLTHDHRRLRLQWANQHRDWRADWQHVVFSDESRFNLWYHDGRIRVRRYAGERHLPECIIERHSGRTPGVMVWGAIAYHRRSQLLRIVGNLNSNRYIREVLQPEAVPFLQSLPGAVFQQDNARPHTARIVKSFFAAQQVQLLPWPACSPDMSPIEHVWDVIGRRLARDPRPVASADELWVRVQTIWNALPQSDIQTLFDSMPRRVAALIAARGGHTKY
ncbi:Transposable element Tcb1 transposase, partial [Stegodyphus mimosarum]